MKCISNSAVSFGGEVAYFEAGGVWAGAILGKEPLMELSVASDILQHEMYLA